MLTLATRLIDSAAATVDRAALAAIQLPTPRLQSRARSYSHDERLQRFALVRNTYGGRDLADPPDAFFVPPPPVQPVVRPIRTPAWGGQCLELSWPSAFEPYCADVRQAYLAHARNRVAWARLYVGPRPRPTAILIHGYRTGQWTLVEHAWPIAWLNRCGLDVAVAVLPFHGARTPVEGGPPPFPGVDPRFTNEGFRQAVADLRVLMATLRRRGAPAVGILGMSLGGYTTTLMATLQEDLAFAVPIIPLASIADFARDQGRLGGGGRAAELHTAIEAANRVVSPFTRPSRIPPGRTLVVGAEADRVTPIAHAERTAAHLGAPLLRVRGGHLMQVWRREAFRAVLGMLLRTGVI